LNSSSNVHVQDPFGGAIGGDVPPHPAEPTGGGSVVVVVVLVEPVAIVSLAALVGVVVGLEDLGVGVVVVVGGVTHMLRSCCNWLQSAPGVRLELVGEPHRPRASPRRPRVPHAGVGVVLGAVRLSMWACR
jgi:hypothetical protein